MGNRKVTPSRDTGIHTVQPYSFFMPLQELDISPQLIVGQDLLTAIVLHVMKAPDGAACETTFAEDVNASVFRMSPQELATQLCQEGDRHLAMEQLPLATAFYMAAFSCSALMAVQKIKSLEKGPREKVIATLETWCTNKSQIPRIHCNNLAIVSLNVGIAAVFLSTLNPNNVASCVYKMEAMLRQGRHEEVVSQCNALLSTHPKHSVELLLTRALAWVLSGTQARKGVVDYIQAFVMHRAETVAYLCSRQKEHLPLVIQTFSDYLSVHREKGRGSKALDSQLGDCYDFIIAVAPDDIQVCRAHAAYLFEKHKFKECVVVYSKALEALSGGSKLGDERALGLLLGRAAAYLSLGGRTREMMQDLIEAFKISPGHAKQHFDELFSSSDTERIEEQARAALDGEFAAYREVVRTRPELRGDGGTELLSPVIHTLQFLLQITPGSRRELSVRLADCQLLSRHVKSSLKICSRLLESEQNTYYNTLLVLRGFCYLHANDCQQALQDFQKVIEHDSPHPNSCVKALCGRGLIRILGCNLYLAALDYITACQLRLDETILTIKSYVPWNQRGLLLKVLQEEGQKILQKKQYPKGSLAFRQKKGAGLNGSLAKEGDAFGVHQLASLLMELDSSDEASQILCADALYQLDRVEEAHRILLVALSRNPQRSPILARLALLQLKKGFLYDGTQLLKKVMQIGDTSCFLLIMDIFKDEDRKLMQTHCHARARTILKNKQGDTYVKEAIAYLSFAIIASGGYAEDSLLTRARCYGHLGQKKTALFDFNAILKEDPRNVQALSGRAFIYLALNQQKEAVQDLTSALKEDAEVTIPEILSLKHDAQVLITQWLLDHCRTVLTELVANKDLPKEEMLKDLIVIGGSLIKISSKEARCHILYTDILIADGNHEEALRHLKESFGQPITDTSANARFAVLQLKRRNLLPAARSLSILAEKGHGELSFLLNVLDTKQRQDLSQVAAQEGNALIQYHHYEKALDYYSLAVLTSNNNPRYLRQRAACLMHLKEYDKALKDMDKVIQKHGSHSVRTQVEDHCSKGHILLSLLEAEAAVKQYIEALQLEQSLALCSISNGPGREILGQTFHQIAQCYFEIPRYEEAWKTVDYGLMIDKNNSELKKLKTRIKGEASGCSVH
ncbi:tetratricopeptide repeat protein 34 [Emydura macquarii macquarii]|uniref:tetratricopeptide repeat protein 34 n=1 Tax=Emydura macquarii macquarii TaxID=1129001 RepID=UPI00352AF7F5